MVVDLVAFALSEKFLATCAGVFLILAGIGFVLIAPHNRLSGRGGAPLPMKSLGNSAVLQIELARRESDLVDVLARGNLSRNLKDTRVGNDLDTFLFVPAYAGFLISVGLLLARGGQRWLTTLLLVAVVAVPVAAACDWMENAGIEATVRHFQEGGVPRPGDAMRISRPSLIKWTILTLVLMTYGLSALGQLMPWRMASGGFAILAVFGTVFGASLGVMLVRYIFELNGT